MTRMFVALLLGTLFAAPAVAQDSSPEEIFATHRDAIYQIKLIDIASESKMSTGSGFQITESGLIATNYHVIQEAIDKPNKFRIEFVDHTKAVKIAHLVAVDVVHDLAIIKAEDYQREPLVLAQQPPQLGEEIFSIGDPFDLGFTLVPGTYNGLAKDSFYQRIHFTGSLNPGMSGGPSLNHNGEVVGVNVSTAGNQISFLVPVEYLHQLKQYALDRNERPATPEELDSSITEQLVSNQNQLYSEMFARDWKPKKMAKAVALSDLPPFVTCWGGSNAEEEDARYLSVESSCRSDDNIYLGPRLNTGTVEYQSFWLQSEELNVSQFYTMYQDLFASFMPGNSAGEDDVGNFSCQDQFVDGSLGTDKLVYCVRAYKRFPGLYDVLYLRGSVSKKRQAYISHFTLAGVSREHANTFTRKFMEVIQWN